MNCSRKSRLVFTWLAITACCLFSFSIQADTFTEGGDAYKQGDFETAAEKFREVAAKGDHRAMYALGSMYAGGTGVKQDYREAFNWFQQAARYGRPDAIYKIGLMYELGVGVRQSYRQAARYYREVGQKGYAHGQFKFGQLYLNGNGVKKDLVKAYAWMITARENFMRTNAGKEDDSNQGPGELPPGDIFADIHLEMINRELINIERQLSSEQKQQALELAREYITYR